MPKLPGGPPALNAPAPAELIIILAYFRKEETSTIVDPQDALLRFRHCLTVAVPDSIEPASTQSDTARSSTAIDPVVDHQQLAGAAKPRGVNVLMNADPVTEEEALVNTDRATTTDL